LELEKILISYPIVAGTQYWFAIAASNGNYGVLYDVGGSWPDYAYRETITSFPATAGATVLSSWRVSIYGVYIPTVTSGNMLSVFKVYIIYLINTM